MSHPHEQQRDHGMDMSASQYYQRTPLVPSSSQKQAGPQMSPFTGAPAHTVDTRDSRPNHGPRQATWGLSASHNLHQHSRLPSLYHHRPQHHPYATPEPAHLASSSSSLLHSSGMHLDSHGRQVSRSACLSCRSAKRKCDGAKPICGPCSLRGVKEATSHQDGGCLYVASKRGGPRFKGIKGAEATKKRLEEREKLGKGRTTRPYADHDDWGYDHVERGRADASLSISPVSSSEPPRAFMAPQRTPSRSNSDLPSLRSFMSDDADSISPSQTISPATPESPALARTDKDRSITASSGFARGQTDLSRYAFGKERETLAQSNYFRSAPGPTGGLFDDLSTANLQMWQNFQDISPSPGFGLANFYQKLENLPKAGAPSPKTVDDMSVLEMDLSHVVQEIESATKASAAVNSEQQARALLSDYYELVYPGCPVMLPSGHLSSLAFHLAEDDSSALLAAVSSCVALQLPQSEVHRIVRGSIHLHGPDEMAANGLHDLEHAPREEIALFHAKSAERLLLKKVAQLAQDSTKTGGDKIWLKEMATSAVPTNIDLELVRIKLVAAHTLLSHYYYGTMDQGKAFYHATHAWNHAQPLHLDATTAATSGPSWFSLAQKCEWARRTYWASYTAATVMSCTGGFRPLSVKRDSPEDLQVLPITHDEQASWKVLVRGAQFVSQSYATLYQLDDFKNNPANQLADGRQQTRQQQQRWESIFDEMQQVDHDVINFTGKDPAWQDESCFVPGVGMHRRTSLFEEENETRLSRSLRIAGKLMTSGALIILHRAQAFANARIFVAPTCGIPGACEEVGESSSDGSSISVKGRRRAPNRLWHRDVEGLPPSGRGRPEEGGNPSSAGQSSGGKVRSRSSSSSESGETQSRSESTGSKPMSEPVLSNCGIPMHLNGGPFDPSVSLGRCRFAASVMYAQLPHISSSTFQHERRESIALLPVEAHGVAAEAASQRNLWSAPCLPPFSACSLVLAAYVLLMETLHAQIASGMDESVGSINVEPSGLLELPPILSSDPERKTEAIPQLVGKQAFQMAIRLRQCIKEIELALEKFARAWDTAKGYAQEVRLLLEVNESLFKGPAAAGP